MYWKAACCTMSEARHHLARRPPQMLHCLALPLLPAPRLHVTAHSLPSHWNTGHCLHQQPCAQLSPTGSIPWCSSASSALAAASST